MELFRLFGRIAVENSEANSAIDDTTGRAEKSESRMSSAFKKIGAAVATYFAIDKIKEFGQAIINTGMEFDAQMSTVASISGATGEELEQLREKAKEMGATTSFSATESAQALEYMAMAGWKTEDMTNGLAGVMNLAAASGEDLASVSDIVTDAMTAFGMSADKSTYFADVLAKTASNANTNVGMMGETFKYVAPVAGAMGYSIEDMSTAIGLMANSGIKGSQAGTALRSTITRLAKPTKQSAAAMDALGLSITNSDGTMKSFMDIMLDMREGFSGLTEDEKASYAAMLGGQEAMSGLLAVVNSSDEDFKKLTDSIKDCDGAAEEMAKVRLDNLQGDVTIMKSAFEAAQIAISEKLSPVLRKVVGKITEWIPKIQAKLTAAFDKIQKKISENKDKIIALKDKFVDLGKYLIKTFSPAFSSLKELFKNIVGAIKPVVEKFLGLSDNSEKAAGSSGMLKTAIELVADVLKKTSDILSGFIKWLTGGSREAEAFKGTIKGIATAFVTYKVAMAAYNAVVNIGKRAVDAYRKAQQLMNTTNPVGWIMLAISAFVGLETALKSISGNPMDKTREQFSKLSDEEQASIDKTAELAESCKSLDESWKNNSEQVEQKFGEYETLAGKLDGIVDKNGKIKEGYEEQAKTICGELSEALGIEIEIVDGVIQKYDELHQSIEDAITMKKANAWLDANEQNYIDAQVTLKDAIDKLVTSENELADVNAELYTAESYLKDIQEKRGGTYEAIIASGKDYDEVLFDQQGKVDGLRERQKKLQSSYDECGEKVSELKVKTKNYSDVMNAVTEGSVEKVNDAMKKGMANLITCETGTEESLRKQTDAYEREYENMKKSVERGNANITEEDLKAKEELYKQAQKELDKYCELHGIKAVEAGDKTAEGLRSKTSDVNAAGVEVGQAGVDGVSSVDYATPGSNAGETYANSMVNSAIEIINGFINSNSYSSGESSIADYVSSVKGGDIPHFASGGIVSRATIAEIGEDGPEAVVPLKNNTEWIDRVAEKVAGKLGKNRDGRGLTVNYIFENVNMSSDSDIEENAYKLEAMRKKAEMAMGGI